MPKRVQMSRKHPWRVVTTRPAVTVAKLVTVLANQPPGALVFVFDHSTGKAMPFDVETTTIQGGDLDGQAVVLLSVGRGDQ